MTPRDRMAQLYPRHWVPILVAFYDMHGVQWDYSLIPATTRDTAATAFIENVKKSAVKNEKKNL
jgi:hypothetical protein